MMIKRFLAACVGVCCLAVCTQADAYEYDKKMIMKEFKCGSGDTVQYAENNWTSCITKENRDFENDDVRIETFINCGMDNLIMDSASRKYIANNTIVLAVGGNPMMGFNTFVAVAPAVSFRITNKTEEPLELDLDHSQITVGSYQGRGVQSGTKYNGAANSVQAPIMIFPKATKNITLWRTDHNFHNGYYFQGQAIVPAKWMPPFDVQPDKNLLGDMILCINKKYITFSPKAVIPSSQLRWEKVKK